jgi:hypothetical protein
MQQTLLDIRFRSKYSAYYLYDHSPTYEYIVSLSNKILNNSHVTSLETHNRASYYSGKAIRTVNCACGFESRLVSQYMFSAVTSLISTAQYNVSAAAYATLLLHYCEMTATPTLHSTPLKYLSLLQVSKHQITTFHVTNLLSSPHHVSTESFHHQDVLFRKHVATNICKLHYNFKQQLHLSTCNNLRSQSDYKYI